MDWATIYDRLKRDPWDPAAWAELQARVGKWARHRLGRHGDTVVEDATAETCEMVIRGLPRARGAKTFGTYAFNHFRNVARRLELEASRVGVSIDDVDLPDEPSERPAADELALLRRCLAELPARDRRAVQLRFFKDASAAAIAETLGVSEVNARRIVFNGLGGLRRCMRLAWPAGRG